MSIPASPPTMQRPKTVLDQRRKGQHRWNTQQSRDFFPILSKSMVPGRIYPSRWTIRSTTTKSCLERWKYHQYAGQTFRVRLTTRRLAKDIQAVAAMDEQGKEYLQHKKSGEVVVEGQKHRCSCDSNDQPKDVKWFPRVAQPLCPYLSVDDGLDPNHSVWFKYNEMTSRHFEPYLSSKDSAKVKIRSLSYEDVEDDGAMYAWLVTWNTKTEERVGEETAKGTCTITDSRKNGTIFSNLWQQNRQRLCAKYFH